METGLRGRAAVVGGASKGLGRAAAEALAAEGCRLLVWSRGGKALEETAEEIRSMYGAEVHAASADAGDPFAAGTIADAARESLGDVDIVVLNSGGPPTADPAGTDAEGWHDAFQLLATTPITLATELLPGMRARRWGRVVAILSSVIRQPVPELVYSSSGRSALALWLKTVSSVVAADGVTVNGVLPGRLDTERVAQLDQLRADRDGRTPEEQRAAAEAAIPAKRYGRPLELGSLVAYLCSEGAGYQTGTFTPVDGGMLQGISLG
jgi:3-oxoacyl-[acyl-carrier protein] reductase